MTIDASLPTLSLTSLAQRCQQESDHYFQRRPFDPRYCYELFRRAVVDEMQRAWDLIYSQYAPQVQRWVEHHASFASSGEDAHYFVNRAFEKMWSALNPEKFTRFPDLKSLLRYLQLCVHSVLIDHVRAKEHLVVEEGSPIDLIDPGGAYLVEEDRQDFWRRVQQRLRNHREQQLLYYRFVLDIKPRDICKRFPQEFPHVEEVHTMTQNILARLRRDPDLRRFLGEPE
jgi:DNA-directed RNA polymerase specialized sigma24 family protein